MGTKTEVDAFSYMKIQRDGYREMFEDTLKRAQRAEFQLALLLAVSVHRAKSLAVMEQFIADLKSASNG